MDKALTKYFFMLLLMQLPLFASAQNWSSLYESGKKYYKEKKLTTAIPILIQARQQAQSEYGQNSFNYKATLKLLAQVYFDHRQFANSSNYYLELVRIMEKNRENTSKEYADNLEALAQTYTEGKRYSKAVEFYEKAVEVRKKVQGKDTEDYTHTLHHLASLYLKGRKYDAAKQYYTELLPIAEKTLKKYPAALADMAKEKGDLHFALKEYKTAIALYEKNLSYLQHSSAPPTQNLEAQQKIAQSYYILEDKEACVKEYLSYMQLVKEAFQDDTSRFEREAKSTIEKLEEFQALAAIIKIYEAQEEIFIKKYGAEDKKIAQTKLAIAQVQKQNNNYESAQQYIQNALAIYQKSSGEKSVDFFETKDELGRLLASQAKDQEAEEIYLETLAARKENLGESNFSYTKALDSLAHFYISQKKYVEADTLLNQLLRIREKKPGKRHASYASALGSMAYLYQEQEKYEKAESLLKEESKIFSAYYGSQSKEKTQSVIKLGDLYKKQNKFTEAINVYRQALPLIAASYGKRSLIYQGVLQRIAEINEETKENH
ncbi:tetratricopeptide repeat protein [Rapidithrix thailandica]|uniref:Tetratricopeptide repeat protein n=1 Tax=Rapidithrix thailandica TaxID=413964 RepID=A0AAW9S2Q6_9BACT